MRGILAVLLIGLAFSGWGASPEWSTDLDQALAAAKKAKKYILVDFSGSDWCGWCIKLDKEVFQKQEFKDFAKDNLILVLLDFPRKKKLPKEEAEKNQAWMEKYGIEGFPSVLIISPEGEMVAQTGYQPGGPIKYIEHLKGLLANPQKGKNKK